MEGVFGAIVFPYFLFVIICLSEGLCYPKICVAKSIIIWYTIKYVVMEIFPKGG